MALMSRDGGKTKLTAMRLPIELFERFEVMKAKEAHKRVPNSDLFIEAIHLYVKLAEKYGLDEDLRPKCTYGTDKKNVKITANGQ